MYTLLAHVALACYQQFVLFINMHCFALSLSPTSKLRTNLSGKLAVSA